MSRRPPVEGYRSPSESSDRLARSRSEHSGIGSTGKWSDRQGDIVRDTESKRDGQRERGEDEEREREGE